MTIKAEDALVICTLKRMMSVIWRHAMFGEFPSFLPYVHAIFGEFPHPSLKCMFGRAYKLQFLLFSVLKIMPRVLGITNIFAYGPKITYKS